MQLGFNKRKYPCDKIKAQAGLLQGDNKLARAVALLDERRGTMSVSKYLHTSEKHQPCKEDTSKVQARLGSLKCVCFFICLTCACCCWCTTHGAALLLLVASHAAILK